MKTNETKFVLPEGCSEITIREGEAQKPLPLKEPKSLSFTGDIHAISDFVKVRRTSAKGIQALDADTIVIEVNKNARTIVMNTDPEGHYNTTITAKLDASEELKQFGINSETFYDRKQLLRLLKFNRGYFPDRTQYDSVINGLSYIRIKTTEEIQLQSDGKGSRKNNDEAQSVMQEGFVDKFKLSVPIFRGFPAENIEVEICFEIVGGSIRFWLESVGLKEATDGAIDEIFKAELANVSDFVIIHK